MGIGEGEGDQGKPWKGKGNYMENQEMERISGKVIMYS